MNKFLLLIIISCRWVISVLSHLAVAFFCCVECGMCVGCLINFFVVLAMVMVVVVVVSADCRVNNYIR